MIKINLLPNEYRKRDIQLPDLGGFLSGLKVIPIIIGSFSFLIGLYLILSVISISKTSTLNKLNAEWESMLGQEKEASKLKREMKGLKKKARLIDELFVERILWSKKLNQLSDLMVDGIWLESLMLGERKKGDALILRGCVASRKKEETALIGKFMEKLRKDKDFFVTFSDIELESIKRRQAGNSEVMEFSLILFLSKASEEAEE